MHHSEMLKPKDEDKILQEARKIQLILKQAITRYTTELTCQQVNEPRAYFWKVSSKIKGKIKILPDMLKGKQLL